jgi:hypothetical protein
LKIFQRLTEKKKTVVSKLISIKQIEMTLKTIYYIVSKGSSILVEKSIVKQKDEVSIYPLFGGHLENI